MVKRLTPDDHARISAAIQAAEATTAGEIFCVLAGRVSSYRDVSFFWATAAALLAPFVLAPLGFDPSWVPGAGDSWEAAHMAARHTVIGQALITCAILQVAIFVAVYGLLRIPRLTRLVTPGSIRTARVREAAMHQFLAHGLQATEARTGVLIFAALADRRVEVVADQGIHALVDDGVWADAVDGLTRRLGENRPVEGFETAIAQVGAVLAARFPPRPDNPDETPNRLVEI